MYPLNDYVYTGWFRDNNVEVDDQDYEFPVCIIIKAQNDFMAKEWGDKIAKKYVGGNSNIEFFKSEISTTKDYKDCNLDRIPVFNYGYEPTDEEIGL